MINAQSMWSFLPNPSHHPKAGALWVPFSVVVGNLSPMLVDPLKTLKSQVLVEIGILVDKIRVLGFVGLFGGKERRYVSSGMERSSAVFH